MSAYALAHIVHLLCAILFVGGVLFEALVLSALHTPAVSREVRRAAEKAVSARAVKVMPWAVMLLFVSGLALAHRYAPLLAAPAESSLALQLWIKILLAFSILIHFIAAVRRMRRGTMTAAFSKYIHRAVLAHMLLIVILAKTMFYLAW